jgi:photosystem II stability/assembly factor-like uncharacterized protein
MVRWLLALAALAGCGGGAHWSLPLAELDRVPLSVAERAPSDVWTVGGALGSGGDALMLRYDGSSWQRITVGTDATLWWVFPRAAASVWAVGEGGTILHWDGTALDPASVPPAPLTTATLYGVWGAADDDLWAVGGDPDVSGVILRRDGGGWHDVTPAASTGAYFKVWGAASDDVFICGQGGVILHWDGAALTPQASGLDARTSLLTIAGRAPDDVYAVGGLGNGVVLHFDGAAWSRLSDPLLDAAPGLAGVSVDADGSVFVVGAGGEKLRGRAGAAWSDETAAATREDLHSVSLVGGALFTVGGNYQAPAPAVRHGVVAHYGGDVSSTIR